MLTAIPTWKYYTALRLTLKCKNSYVLKVKSRIFTESTHDLI